MKTQPFYVGEQVVAVNALPGAFMKNGKVYRVVWCNQYFCKGSYWWGVRIDAEPDWTIRSSIFASLNHPIYMSFETIQKQQPIIAN